MKTMTYILNLAVFAAFSMTFAADNNSGSKEMFISIEDAQVAQLDKDYYKPDMPTFTRSAPDWQDNPGGYQFVSFLVGGIVLDAGEQMGGEGDMFAAFGADGSVDKRPSRSLQFNGPPFY